VGPSVSWTPHVSLSHSREETVTHPTRYRARYRPKPIPFLCSSPRCPPVKFRPHPTPRCSIQAFVSCLSHPLACGPLASCIATETSRRPAVPANRCHCRCTAAIPVPSTQRQRLTQRLFFLLPCWHRVRLRLASSFLAPRRVDTVRCHAHARQVATTSPLSSSPTRHRRTDKSAYKRRPPHCLASASSASCPPLVSCHHRASPLFPPHCRCRATSPLLSPRV
jgi:hypothetical protein